MLKIDDTCYFLAFFAHAASLLKIKTQGLKQGISSYFRRFDLGMAIGYGFGDIQKCYQIAISIRLYLVWVVHG